MGLIKEVKCQSTVYLVVSLLRQATLCCTTNCASTLSSAIKLINDKREDLNFEHLLLYRAVLKPRASYYDLPVKRWMARSVRSRPARQQPRPTRSVGIKMMVMLYKNAYCTNAAITIR